MNLDHDTELRNLRSARLSRHRLLYRQVTANPERQIMLAHWERVIEGCRRRIRGRRFR